MSSTEIATAAVSGTATLNPGLYDMQLALQWVQHNIEGFGGDKNKVTRMRCHLIFPSRIYSLILFESIWTICWSNRNGIIAPRRWGSSSLEAKFISCRHTAKWRSSGVSSLPLVMPTIRLLKRVHMEQRRNPLTEYHRSGLRRHSSWCGLQLESDARLPSLGLSRCASDCCICRVGSERRGGRVQ